MADTTAGTLAGKVAIVTGAASGIGRAIALRYGREGAHVIVSDINAAGGNETVAMISAAGGTAAFIACDVSDPAAAQSMVDQAAADAGHLDILVNNAGVGSIGKAVDEVPIENFQHVIATNLMGPFYCARAAIPHLRASGGGAIINIASSFGIIASPKTGPYAAAKGGLISLTRQMAVDYSREHIRVNCICPGYIDTDLGGRRAAMSPEDAAFAFSERERKAAMQPIGRQAQADEVAGAAVFLAGPDASFIVGAAIVVDGGQTILHNQGPYFES